jgi:hypothetical protein
MRMTNAKPRRRSDACKKALRPYRSTTAIRFRRSRALPAAAAVRLSSTMVDWVWYRIRDRSRKNVPPRSASFIELTMRVARTLARTEIGNVLSIADTEGSAGSYGGPAAESSLILSRRSSLDRIEFWLAASRLSNAESTPCTRASSGIADRETAFYGMPRFNCDDTVWICENHPSRATAPRRRACSADMPWPFCNAGGGIDELPIETGIGVVDKDGRPRRTHYPKLGTTEFCVEACIRRLQRTPRSARALL